MMITIAETKKVSGHQAAVEGAYLISQAIAERGDARVILATGSSQFDMLEALVAHSDINWSKCTVFHLDEYVGLAPTHPASFVGYLTNRFVNRVPNLGHFEAIDGLNDPDAELLRLNRAIAGNAIDVAFVGIGENGHLAFNDPPADFEANTAYLKVELDVACRNQQVSEGWFPDFADVPTQALSMSIPQILKSRAIVCTVSDTRKAEAVENAIEGPISNLCPASALQMHNAAHLFLDAPAAALLSAHAADGISRV